MNDPALITTRPLDRPLIRHYSRIVREARFLAAANLGALGGLLVWRSVSKEGRAAEALTLAKYTANFATYRKGLIDSGRIPLVAYVLVVAVFAVIAMVCYEFLVSVITRFLASRSGEQASCHPETPAVIA